MCNHDDARAFEDLAEFLDHFLFLGSIHSITPSSGGADPSGSVLADKRRQHGPHGSFAKSPSKAGTAPKRIGHVPVSGRNYALRHPPSRTNHQSANHRSAL
ncbi:hypothetical protein RGUI_2934 [Rhodovulum sp. P5]|nr:hypothetical protein RGUI_2934 [Rhodovulum sp. P5]